ncbi:hypothetical protein BDW59DRAFT_154432 [Aspergillus cavernicola]|uniref:Zn(2)-C6 fungal-type domain-containing protein n=1 Tax=Aspergillus cavernicola TaxID=176166 RepID=A0ABR4HFU2_9EURO
MTRSRNLRLYRACQRCRQRKLKCDPTSSPDGTRSSCQQCFRAGNECILAGSRRGGDFSRFRRSPQGSSTPGRMADTAHNPAMQAEHYEEGPENPIYAELTNPGDALQILARLATNDIQLPNNPLAFADSSSTKRAYSEAVQPNDRIFDFLRLPATQPTLSEMEILVLSVLGTDKVGQLLHRYAMNYHTFCPLVPKSLLATTDLRKPAVDEPFLLGVILMIASKDEVVYHDIHRQCWQYLKQYLLDILVAAPSTLNVGSVEGLLLLAEWVPYLQIETSCYSRLFPGNVSAVEDNMAWSLIGQAVRHSYLLRLDKASFREASLGEPQELENRKRLAWIFVYIADRQISVRMGQSFWSRGPSLSTRFTVTDFPSLCLSADAEHRYAQVLQASIELTQLLHNVHDILYASKERRLQMVRRGDYNRYLDDFRCSLSAWQGRWDDLDASPKLSSTLRIVKEYVRLYVNGFAFHSILSRAVHENCLSGDAPSGTASAMKRAPSLFPQGIISTGEGAYVLEAIDAARNILTIITRTNPELHIRYMPFRFYVYTVYSAVFLYKADIFGALVRAEHIEITSLVQQYIHVLEAAATNDCHVASRFASLLKRMWMTDRTSSTAPSHMNSLPGQSDALEDINLAQRQVNQDAAFGMRDQEPVCFPTPEFNLFCPELSSWETELADLGMGAPEFPI